MRNLALSLSLLCALLSVAAGGCATKIYQGPTSGRAAEAQQAVSMSLDHALARFDAKPFRGMSVALEVYALAERLEGESPEESYVRSLLTEKLLEAGAKVSKARADATVLLMATLRCAGVDIIRRDFPFIYHHTTFRGLASLRLTAMALEKESATRLLRSQRLAATSIFREAYILYVIGPITTRYTEEVPAAP